LPVPRRLPKVPILLDFLRAHVDVEAPPIGVVPVPTDTP
jgi:hypothetical protein